MTDFHSTNWAKHDFVQQYRDNADIYIVERRKMFEIMKSFYLHFIFGRKGCNVLDLGCGDGIITHEILGIDNSIRATLIDGSDYMLSKAKERLKDFPEINYINISFQEILKKGQIDGTYDFVASSQAIHHLAREEKQRFYEIIYSCLDQGGFFINIDVTIAPEEILEQWYMLLWKEWMDNKKSILGIEGDQFNDVIARYKEADENKPDTLEEQLTMLKDIGFMNVDCFYKYGIFAVFGGMKR
jgi:tRNA (cmo5U34)-methyltransferase